MIKKKKKEKKGVSLNLKEHKKNAFLKLILIMRIRFPAFYFGQVAKTNLVRANRNRHLVVHNGRGDCTQAICCLFARGILQQFS